MANQDAWDTGWAMGSGKGKKTGAKKTSSKKAKGGTGSDANAPRGLMEPTTTFQAAMPGVRSYKKGGHVKKTGLALLHKGEYVVPAQRRKATRKRTITKR